MEEDEENFENVFNIMEDQDLDYEEAKELQGIMDTEGLSTKEAIEARDFFGTDHNGRINWIGIIAIIILAVWAYNHFTSKTIKEDYGYQVQTSGITKKPDCSSLAPNNLYDYNSGHYAGFEWGADGNNCVGNSDSFIEGCEEYQNQKNAYQYCLDRSK